MKTVFSYLFIFVLLTSCSNHSTKIKKLELVKSYSVLTKNKLEPSGLTFWNDVFYTVSDKDNYIYQLVFNKDTVELDPVIEIINNKDSKLDFEGITHDDENFYLISEKHFQILKISKDGLNQSWLLNSSRLKTAGENVGLFKTKNANIEGICKIEGKFVLVAERQPRGFVEYNIANNIVKAYQVDESVFFYKNNRSPDFTGLSCDNGMYVLDRNAYMVSKLIQNNNKYRESIGYSYEHIVSKPELKYQDMKYGQAEGLVVKNNKVFIILDNNRNYHLLDSNDNNSLFLELKF